MFFVFHIVIRTIALAEMLEQVTSKMQTAHAQHQVVVVVVVVVVLSLKAIRLGEFTAD